MSTLMIFMAGLFVTFLCVMFVVISAKEMRKLGAEADQRSGRG